MADDTTATEPDHTSTANTDSEPPDGTGSDHDSVYAEAVRVHDAGRVTIPSRHRDRLDIEQHDIIDLLVYAGEDAFSATDLPVDASGRVRIPGRKRDLYGIEDDDRVDIEVAATDMTMNDGEE